MERIALRTRRQQTPVTIFLTALLFLLAVAASFAADDSLKAARERIEAIRL